MRKIYLVRHGQSVANAGGDAQPNAEIELTELGHQQAEEVAEWVIETFGTDIESIGISKFIRTAQTAQPLLDKTKRQAVVIENLEEFDYLSFDKIAGTSLSTRTQMADDYWLNQHPTEAHGDDAESYQQFYNRVAAALETFASLPKGNHIMFTHGLWISMLIWQILSQPASNNLHMRKFRQFEMAIRAKNTEVFCLTLSDNQPPAITKVRSFNDDVEFVEYR